MKYKLIGLISALTFSPLNYAQNQSSSSWEGPVKVNLNLYAFASDANGEIQKGNIHYDVDQPFKDSLDYLDETYMAHFDISKGRWGMFYDTQMAKLSTEQSVAHIPVAAYVKQKRQSLGAYYQAYVSERNPNNNYPRFIVEPMIGVHRTELKSELSAFHHTSQVNADWDEVFWGSRFKYNFDSPWNLASELSFGVEDTRSAQMYVGYRQEIFKRPINFRLGYRYFEQDHHSGDFKWHITQHGPVIGVNLPLF
ncbi:hypothetical protein [Acinetobacter rudis]|uniref:DUF2490 domain-containing protein n=1 Tax=Acinetobacter rudis CIP 110305 TaxID=421052 RepID=S3MQI9_9GAMM|nr:hypothetical protein [Acinetobacter rudis]EPF69882.1 hypothetical protein F945_03631 [Acinetobacter rudis CIP 110305]